MRLSSHRKTVRAVAFVLTGCLAIGVYVVVLQFPDRSVPGWVLAARTRAAASVRSGQAVVVRERHLLGLAISPADRLRTGMIGVETSPITTELGSLQAKRTSTNPLFAAAIVDMLWRSGTGPGDAVAIGMTGSFPSLNLASLAAVEAIGATPLAISSVGSSQWGANEPELSWPVMEETLARGGVIRHRSLAIAPGGTELAGQPTAEVQERRRLAAASGLALIPNIPIRNEVAYRVSLYERAAASSHLRIAAFVNVGGSAADIGPGSAGEGVIPTGLSHPVWGPFEASQLGVVGALRIGLRIPIVNLSDVARLANRYDLRWDPSRVTKAADLPKPPPDPLASAVALLFLLSVVVGAHRAGLFRMPDWEMPEELRRTARAPGEARDPPEPATALGISSAGASQAAGKG